MGAGVLYVGRLSPWNKMDLLPLVVAFAQIVQRQPEPRPILLLVGQEQADSYTQLLLASATELAVADRVEVWDQVPPAQIPDVYGLADVFVSPCDCVQESFGLTPLEAMASGLPAVVSAWDGYKETVIEGRTGYLVPVYRAPPDAEVTDAAFYLDYRRVLYHMVQTTAVDLDVLADRLALLVADADLRRRMGAQARAHVEAHYSWPNIISTLETRWIRERDRAEQEAASWSRRADPPVYRMDYDRLFRHYPSAELDVRSRVRRGTWLFHGPCSSDSR